MADDKKKHKRRRQGRKVGPGDKEEVTRALVVYQPEHSRQSTFRPELAGAIVEAVRRGAYRSVAAAAVGVPKSTLAGWVKRGTLDLQMAEEAIEKGYTVRLTEFADFVLKLGGAEALYELDLSGIIDLHSIQDWRAAAWKLERTRPDRYGRRLEVSVKKLVTDVTAAMGVDEEELLTRVAAALREHGG